MLRIVACLVRLGQSTQQLAEPGAGSLRDGKPLCTSEFIVLTDARTRRLSDYCKRDRPISAFSPGLLPPLHHRMAQRSKGASIGLLAICELAALAVWFSATAIAPSVLLEHALTPTQVSMFTSSVQVGFVTGTLLSAVLGLADRVDPRNFFMVSAFGAAAANASILLVAPSAAWVYVARFITGMCMAGVYPVGMRMVASWAKDDLGLLVAILVGALTLGSASPHLFNAFGGVDWRFTILATSLAAALAGFAVNLVGLGPRHAVVCIFSPRHLAMALRAPSLRWANLGYLGHMWELYAMWSWIGLFLTASFRISSAGHDPDILARVTTFIVIGIGGAAGCLTGGWIADRYGRTLTTMTAMTMSGACALAVGPLFGCHPLLVGLLCLLWGAAAVADSAQFSASVCELADPKLIGTMLTAQTCAGFTLTLLTIHLVPYFVEAIGWSFAFAPLALGPAFGVWAMARLRAQPDSPRLANGNR
jgi:MFS family permease